MFPIFDHPKFECLWNASHKNLGSISRSGVQLLGYHNMLQCHISINSQMSKNHIDLGEFIEKRHPSSLWTPMSCTPERVLWEKNFCFGYERVVELLLLLCNAFVCRSVDPGRCAILEVPKMPAFVDLKSKTINLICLILQFEEENSFTDDLLSRILLHLPAAGASYGRTWAENFLHWKMFASKDWFHIQTKEN